MGDACDSDGTSAVIAGSSVGDQGRLAMDGGFTCMVSFVLGLTAERWRTIVEGGRDSAAI